MRHFLFQPTPTASQHKSDMGGDFNFLFGNIPVGPFPVSNLTNIMRKTMKPGWFPLQSIWGILVSLKSLSRLVILPALLLCAATHGVLQAQSNDCNWNIVVYDEPKPSGSLSDPGVPPECEDQNACSPVYYYVYLERDGDANCSGSGCPYTVGIANLDILGKLDAFPGVLTNKVHSKLNEKKSIECTPVALNDPFNSDAFDFSVDEKNSTFSFYYSGLTGETTSLTVYGRKLLFVIAVDAFPGETVEVSTTSVTLQHPNEPPCSAMAISDDASPKNLLQPSACALPSLLLRMGSVVNDPTTDFPNRKKVAVFMTSADAVPTNYTIDALDFLMEITSMQFMGNLLIEPVNASMTAEWYNEPSALSTMDRRVYAKGEQIQLTTSTSNTPTTANTLFYLVFNGPLLASDCATTTVALTSNRRMVFNGSCCTPSTGDTERELEWGISSDCPLNCTYNTVKIEEPTAPVMGANDCTDLFFNVNLYTAVSGVYEEAKIVLDVHYSGAALSWSSSLSSSAYCTPSACITATALAGQSNVLRVTIDIFSPTPDINVSPTNLTTLAQLGFQGTGTCITGVEVYDAYLVEKDDDKECLPQFESIYQTGPDNSGDDLCTKRFPFSFRPWWNLDKTVTDVDYTYTAGGQSGCEFTSNSQTGSGSLCLCTLPGVEQVFTPEKDSDLLNGVSTYDLVLISSHITGLTPLGNPYRIIAADVNSTGSITTFDIVQAREVILGLDDDFDGTNSWRFVDAAFAFPNLDNPFQTTFPEDKKFFIPPFGKDGHFIALKVGDVNGTAIYNRPEVFTTGIGYATSTAAATKGETGIAVPVYAQRALSASAWQMVLNYDPTLFKLKDVRITGPELAGSLNNGWHEPTPGEVRVLWFDADANAYDYQEGEPLFFLELEALDQKAELSLQIDEQTLHAEAYELDGNPRRFVLQKGEPENVRARPERATQAAAPLWSARVYPNPNTGVFRVNVNIPEAGSVTVQLSDQHGSLLHRQQIDLPAGDALINTAAWPRLQPGAYTLHVQSSFGTQQLALVVTNRL
jgi:hypothetical protein